MRPVPVVRLRFDLFPQLYTRFRADGYPHDEQRPFWMWYDRRPQRTHSVCDLLVRFPKLDVPFVCRKRSQRRAIGLDYRSTFARAGRRALRGRILGSTYHLGGRCGYAVGVTALCRARGSR